MPHGDHMGPKGEGPRTGRGMGLCSGRKTPGYLTAPPNTQAGNGKSGGRHNQGIGQGIGHNGQRGWHA